MERGYVEKEAKAPGMKENVACYSQQGRVSRPHLGCTTKGARTLLTVVFYNGPDADKGMQSSDLLYTAEPVMDQASVVFYTTMNRSLCPQQTGYRCSMSGIAFSVTTSSLNNPTRLSRSPSRN